MEKSNKEKSQKILDELNSDPNSPLVFYDIILDSDGNPFHAFAGSKELHVCPPLMPKKKK